MIHLFSEKGLRALARYADAFVAFDYDGTLAPIVRVPSEAKAAPHVQELLARLAAERPTAIITGRGLLDITERLPDPNLQRVGNHGIEGSGVVDEAARSEFIHAVTGWVDQLTQGLGLLNNDDRRAGILIEDKIYSLSVHYRGAADPFKAKELILAASTKLLPRPRVQEGDHVVNLLPQGAPNKGVAMMELWKRSGRERAIFVGDDVTDEDVFQLPVSNLLKVRVGRGDGSAAEYFVESVDEVARILEYLTDAK